MTTEAWRATASAMADLRTATAEAHGRIEARIDLDARLASPATYRDLLTRFLGFHAPVEAWLEPVAGRLAGLDFAGRRKAHLLEADLASLRGAAGPELTGLPATPDVDTALGILYVLEGSTLGGKVVARRAHRMLAAPPTAFLNAYGDAVGARWRAFGAVVDRHAPAGATEGMIAGAIWCFATQEAWLVGANDPFDMRSSGRGD